MNKNNPFYKIAAYYFHKTVRYVKRVIGMPTTMVLSYKNVQKVLALRWQRLFYHRKYDTNELLSKFRELGLQEGSCVMFQSSWDSFFNYEGNAKELIDGILNVIGPTGTLAMPAFPINKEVPLNLKRSMTGAGLIAETFRRYPGVKRSVSIQHSVCALGPLSDYLTSEHIMSETCWDEKSPYYKLSKVNSIIFCVGVGYSFLSTSYHCVESINRGKIPYYTDFFAKEKTVHQYIDYDGILKEYECYDLAPGGRSLVLWPEKWFLYRFFSKKEYRTSRISNLTISAFYAGEFIPKAIKLGSQGKDLYRHPSKKGYKFEK